jgi:ABC-type multidrug transport system ATPase subunit
MTNFFLKGEAISFSYPGEKLFSDFSFSVQEGENVVFRGESGSGKSTLFRLIMGFEEPDSGKIYYRGKRLSGEYLTEFRKETAWLPQDLNLGDGTVKDVMNFPFTFRSHGNSIPEHNARIKMLQDLGMDSDTYTKEYSDLSTGQRQRVGIALCLLLDKPILMLDEPTSALDKASKERVLQHLKKGEPRTILSTSHDPWWVERCDRIIDLNNEESL